MAFRANNRMGGARWSKGLHLVLIKSDFLTRVRIVIGQSSPETIQAVGGGIEVSATKAYVFISA